MSNNNQISLFPIEEIESIEESYPSWFSSFSEFKKKKESQVHKRLKVYYGFRKLTKKVIRKREICAWFENDFALKNEKFINRRIHIVFVREQTDGEKIDGLYSNRMWTYYSKKIDEKPFNGNFEHALQYFVKSETIGVSEEMKKEIEDRFRKYYELLKY